MTSRPFPAQSEDFNEWYNREHMPERIFGVPGFVRGRRNVAPVVFPRFVAYVVRRGIALD